MNLWSQEKWTLMWRGATLPFFVEKWNKANIYSSMVFISFILLKEGFNFELTEGGRKNAVQTNKQTHLLHTLCTFTIWIYWNWPVSCLCNVLNQAKHVNIYIITYFLGFRTVIWQLWYCLGFDNLTLGKVFNLLSSNTMAVGWGPWESCRRYTVLINFRITLY